MEGDSFKVATGGGVSWLECAALTEFPGLLHAFSTRLGGISGAQGRDLNLGRTDWDSPAHIEENCRRFIEALGARDFSLLSLRQVHSSIVVHVTRESSQDLGYQCPGESRPASLAAKPDGDALLSSTPGLLLAVRVADCLPILLADPRNRAVAAIHAGWRGALQGIVGKAAGEMARAFGSRPDELMAAVGPSIRACCYEVREDVWEACGAALPDGQKYLSAVPRLSTHSLPGTALPRSFFLDLAAIARDQLLRAGVSDARIFVADYCTACRTDLFFSYRKEGPKAGRMLAVIGFKPDSS